MIELLKNNWKFCLYLFILLAGCSLNFVAGCDRGSASGYASGYTKGQEDARCQGGSHARPFPR